MKLANPTTSVIGSSPWPVLTSSSGVGLNTQPATAERSLVNTSLETPCSTL
jgi:hypothetical protein